MTSIMTSIISVEKTKRKKMTKTKTSSSSTRSRRRPLLCPLSLSKSLPLFTITESLYHETAPVSACSTTDDAADKSILSPPSIKTDDRNNKRPSTTTGRSSRSSKSSSTCSNRSFDILTKAYDVIDTGDINSEVVDEDEDELIKSITTPSTITCTTISARQQDRRLLHIISRWDANYTTSNSNSNSNRSNSNKRNYNNNYNNEHQGLLFVTKIHRPRYSRRSSSSSSRILDCSSNNNNDSKVIVDRPPISPVRRRTMMQHRIDVAQVA
jgi:hypothetical protein